MQQRNQVQPLRIAAAKALRMGGIRVLDHPNQFVGIVEDDVDMSTDVAKVFSYSCDERLLSYLKDAAARRTPEAMEECAAKLSHYLQFERVIQAQAAEKLACELTFALANHVRVPCPERVRMVAVADVSQAQGMGSRTGGSNADNAWLQAQQERERLRRQGGSGSGGSQGTTRQVGQTQTGSGSGSRPGSGSGSGSRPGPGSSQGSGSGSGSGSSGSGTAPVQNWGGGPKTGTGQTVPSPNIAQRRRQIDAAGISLLWYDFLTWLHRIKAFVALIVLLDMASKGTSSAESVITLLAWFVCLVWASYAMAHFKKSGPTLTYVAIGIECIYLALCASGMFYWPGTAETCSLLLVADVILLICTGAYFEKRKQWLT